MSGFVPFFDYFRLSTDANVIDVGQTDYSSAPASFRCNPDSQQTAVIAQIRIVITHLASSDAEFFGMGPALTNGLRLYFKEGDSIIADLTGAVAIKTSSQTLSIVDGVEHVEFAGNHDGKILHIDLRRWGDPLAVDGKRGQYLELSVNDDFRKLTSMIWSAQGYLSTQRYA